MHILTQIVMRTTVSYCMLQVLTAVKYIRVGGSTYSRRCVYIDSPFWGTSKRTLPWNVPYFTRYMEIHQAIYTKTFVPFSSTSIVVCFFTSIIAIFSSQKNMDLTMMANKYSGYQKVQNVASYLPNKCEHLNFSGSLHTVVDCNPIQGTTS